MTDLGLAIILTLIGLFLLGTTLYGIGLYYRERKREVK